MEFDYCLQSSGDHDQEMEIMRQNLDINQLDGDGEEDDIFYAEIRRQILLLTADDDEEVEEEENFNESRNSIHPNSWSASKERLKGSKGRCYPCEYNCNFNRWENKKVAADSIPNWLANLWKNNGNGTGVFIPQTNTSKRNQRLRKMNRERTKIYRPVGNKS
ncbi:uncharacterized protein LOC107429511 [Ziziphus jujuba]|uniref:Uncharacterized protein LOC107429511 n=1 Tax=Ziziphus jujuba TaxID=326968 RepID=A0A6P4AKU6_ZIZJJ|nr:uncharacterized protein LOC107429511 [Ziziphus jujuba]